MLTQKQKDISLLLDIRALIMSPSQNVTLIKSLAQIGNLLSGIAWKEDDETCIRNTHGLRNRHQKKGNKLNTKGAKLDFETLSHLKALAEDQQACAILLNNKEEINHDLKKLEAKIDYIISAEYLHLSEEQRSEASLSRGNLPDSEESDLGMLWRAAAYHHDQQCLHQLIALLTTFDDIVNEDLNAPLQRYRLGYLLCQLGEYAKELSGFIKPESYQQSEKNVTRFMFGKLGQYRQKIKQSPFIIRKKNTRELQQMRLLIRQVSPQLKPLLIDLRNRLQVFSKQENIRQYHDCNKPDQVCTSEFEKKWAACLIDITRKLSLGITFLDSLSKKRSEYSAHMTTLLQQKKDLEQAQNELSIHSSTVTILPPNNDMEQIRVLLHKEELLDYLDAPLNDLKLLAEQLDLASHAKLKGLLISLHKKLKKPTIEQQLSTDYGLSSTWSLRTLKEALEITVTETSSANPSESNHAQKLQALTQQLKEIEKNLRLLTESIVFLAGLGLEETTQNHPQSLTATSVKPSQNFFYYIFEEITFIESFYRLDEKLSSHSIKMALGWIGHYAKEIRKNSNTSTNLKQYTHVLVEICFKKAEYLRSKVIMHGMANEHNAQIEQAWSECILPTKDDIRALSIIGDPQSSDLLLARAFMRLDEHGQARGVLQDHLASLKAGRVQYQLSENPEDYTQNVAHLLPILQSLRQTSRDRFGCNEKTIETVENYMQGNLEKSTALMLSAKCYQHGQSEEDFQAGLQCIDEALQIITYQLNILKQPTQLSRQSAVQCSADKKLDEWLFCQSIKSFFLIKLNKTEQAAAILLELNNKFDQSILAQGKFATRIIHFLTDLATITQDLALQERYIEKARSHLLIADRKVFSAYLIQFRYYEHARQCFEERQNPENFNRFQQKVRALDTFFKKNRNSLQQENGMKIFEYEGTVIMAKLEMRITNIETYAVDIVELFTQMEHIEAHLSYEINKRYYALKFIYFSRREQTKLFQDCLQKFVAIGEEHDPTNFRYTLLTMLNDLIRWNLASFILVGLDFIKRKFITLTEEESTTEMIALDMQCKKTPVLSSCHFIVHDGLRAMVKQLNRITAELRVESWGYTSDNTLVLVSTTAPFEDIKNYLKTWDIGEIRINQDRQKSICIYNLKGKNLSNIPPLALTTKITVDCRL